MFANQPNLPKNNSLAGPKTLPDIIKLTPEVELGLGLGLGLGASNESSKKKYCQKCHKKVGLMGFECRCGRLFCGTHRYAEEHDCNYDYMSLYKQELMTKLDNKGLFLKIENI
jgi:hypothetical protein